MLSELLNRRKNIIPMATLILVTGGCSKCPADIPRSLFANLKSRSNYHGCSRGFHNPGSSYSEVGREFRGAHGRNKLQTPWSLGWLQGFLGVRRTKLHKAFSHVSHSLFRINSCLKRPHLWAVSVALPGSGSNSYWEAQRVLQYSRDHSVATVDFSETSPVCGSRSAAAAAAARLNSHSSQMSAVVMEGARENVSFGFEFP